MKIPKNMSSNIGNQKDQLQKTGQLQPVTVSLNAETPPQRAIEKEKSYSTFNQRELTFPGTDSLAAPEVEDNASSDSEPCFVSLRTQDEINCLNLYMKDSDSLEFDEEAFETLTKENNWDCEEPHDVEHSYVGPSDAQHAYVEQSCVGPSNVVDATMVSQDVNPETIIISDDSEEESDNRHNATPIVIISDDECDVDMISMRHENLLAVDSGSTENIWEFIEQICQQDGPSDVQREPVADRETNEEAREQVRPSSLQVSSVSAPAAAANPQPASPFFFSSVSANPQPALPFVFNTVATSPARACPQPVLQLVSNSSTAPLVQAVPQTAKPARKKPVSVVKKTMHPIAPAPSTIAPKTASVLAPTEQTIPLISLGEAGSSLQVGRVAKTRRRRVASLPAPTNRVLRSSSRMAVNGSPSQSSIDLVNDATAASLHKRRLSLRTKKKSQRIKD